MASRFWAWTHGYYVSSVLPRIAGTRTTDGFNVTIDRTGRGELVTWGCAVIVFAFGLFLVTQDILGPRRAIGSDLALLAAIGGLAAGVRQVLVRRRFRKGTLHVKPWPIRLGSQVTAELHAFVAGEQAAPAARLECIEEASRGKGGRYEQMKSATIYSCDLPPAKLQWTGTKAHAVWTFAVPVESPASFQVRSRQIIELRERKVEWRVVTTMATDLGETSAEFVLLVVPEVVA